MVMVVYLVNPYRGVYCEALFSESLEFDGTGLG